MDPMPAHYPHQSPIEFTDNNPIMLWDPKGMSAEEVDGIAFDDKDSALLHEEIIKNSSKHVEKVYNK